MKRSREIIADNLSKAGWSWRWVSALDSQGRTIWIADAHRDNGKRFVVHADKKLTAFLELESVVHPDRMYAFNLPHLQERSGRCKFLGPRVYHRPR